MSDDILRPIGTDQEIHRMMNNVLRKSRVLALAGALIGCAALTVGCGSNGTTGETRATAASATTPAAPVRPDLLVDRPCRTVEVEPTPIVRAIYDGNVDRVISLLDAGTDVNEQDANWETLLHHAARSGQNEIIKILLERGAEVNARARCNATPLMWAARTNRLEACRILVEAGADVNARGGRDDRFTAMGFAASSNYMDVVDLLRDSGGTM